MPTLAELAQLSDNAYVGYPQLQRQAARMRQAQAGRTAENLPDPRTYGFMQGLTGTSPDELGMSVLSPNTAPAKDAAYYGYQLANLGQMAPALGVPAKAAIRAGGQAINDAMVYGTGPLAKITPQPMRMLPPSQYVGKPLEGLPGAVDVGGKMEQFGTDQRLVDIAKGYMADRGFIYTPQTKYAQVDPQRAAKLADAYEVMANNPNDPKVKKAYKALIEETMGQYEALRKKGYKFDFMPESGDIYGNPRNAINDIVGNKRLSVFPTEQGFGGPSAASASQANPLLMRIGEKWNGKEVTANDIFRAVHDVFGHAKHGVGFRAGGEENAFQAHARMYSPQALPAVTSETRGQNSWVNFGPHGQFNRTTNPLLTEYAEQKTGLLPAWAWKEGISK
jgi:hypothetical protein